MKSGDEIPELERTVMKMRRETWGKGAQKTTRGTDT